MITFFFIIALIFLYAIGGGVLVGVVLSIIVAFLIYDHIQYPNKYRGTCKYCNKAHKQIRYTYWLSELGEKYCYDNGYVFQNKECLKSWRTENFFCSNCNELQHYNIDEHIEYKFKRKYFYFCTELCLNEWRKKHPEYFYEGHKRHSIPSDVRKIVWNRDNGKCCKCGSDNNIEFDHIVPVSKGGSSTVNNIELLCQICNRSKSDRIE